MSSPHVLFVCHDAGGTVPPVLAVAQALVQLGTRVSILSQPSVRLRAEAAGCGFFAFSSLDDYDRHQPIESQLSLSIPALTGTSVGDDLIATLSESKADLVVVDPNLTGALAAAESVGCASVVLLHSMYKTFVDTWFAELWQFLADPINATRGHFGVGPATSWASLFDNHDLIVSPVPAIFDDPSVERPAAMRSYGFLVPPASGNQVAFPAGGDPAVLVSLSTTFQNQTSLLHAIVDALADLPVRALVTTAGHVAPGELRASTNVTITDFADHSAALAEASVMVTHAGLGSTAAALSAGVPLVCTPIGRDQPLNARRAATLGAAIVVENFTTADIAQAVSEAIATSTYRMAARAIASAAEREGGTKQAAADISALIN
jgi:UDP:flavonoid glycosyltransferase YjiC (YdhE family)